MRRQVKRIAVCVVVGVVVNVLVAWVAAWFQVNRDAVPQSLSVASVRWPRGVPSDVGDLTSAQIDKSLGAKTIQYWRNEPLEGFPRDGFNVYWFQRDAGWPLSSMRCELGGEYWYGWEGIKHAANRPPRTFTAGVFQNGIKVPASAITKFGARTEYIPVRPLPIGFLVNTIAWGALAWGVMFAPGVVKRWRRRRRGACVGCGYDLKQIAAGGVCPECGGEK